MRGWWLSALLVMIPPCASGQQADCPSAPSNSGSGLPLSIDLAGRPGVPSGVTGQVYIQVPSDPRVIALAWAAAAGGWMLAELAPLGLSVGLEAANRARAARLRARRERLLEEWPGLRAG